MTWNFTDDVDAFLATAGPSLAARPAENTLLLTITATLRSEGPLAYGPEPPVLGWWSEPDGEVTGALVHTPPFVPVLGTVPAEALGPLAETVALRGVNADRATATALSARWPDHRVDAEHRLYRLGTLVPPCPAPAGGPRPAGSGDRELLVGWVRAFGEETGQSGTRAEQIVDTYTARGGLTVWEADGAVVSMAGVSRKIADSVRVSVVYTPPEHRGRGYAAAVTAEVSGAARAEGAAEVLLFTDLANPTSNGVYLRIGYEAVSDRLVITAVPE
ncbi:GNAT family N-acetyltransferase [Streptomyces sp. NPDC059166]|uniref:GNAT family N-acetyltransferase n=1 Tax=Streptomyces sp. NPDC059166 TaxID=3346752 RepID=UPI0036BBB3BA